MEKKRFEYRIETGFTTLLLDDKEMLTEYFNILGKNGWECCGVLKMVESEGILIPRSLLFKRERFE